MSLQNLFVETVSPQTIFFLVNALKSARHCY